MVEKDERVPADLVLLRTSDKSGAVFVRTDQLDGETDWKLRLAVPATQKLENDSELFNIDATIYIEKPQRDIHSFIGTFAKQTSAEEESLDVENTIWANTVVAAGTATGIVVYTGCETRSVMNNSQPRSKVGLLDMEINGLTKVLFCAVIGLSLAMMCLKGFNGPWYRYMFRFVLLFSYIIPISLRVNLDMGKAFYSYQIQNDPEIQGNEGYHNSSHEHFVKKNCIQNRHGGSVDYNSRRIGKDFLSANRQNWHPDAKRNGFQKDPLGHGGLRKRFFR